MVKLTDVLLIHHCVCKKEITMIVTAVCLAAGATLFIANKSYRELRQSRQFSRMLQSQTLQNHVALNHSRAIAKRPPVALTRQTDQHPFQRLLKMIRLDRKQIMISSVLSIIGTIFQIVMSMAGALVVLTLLSGSLTYMLLTSLLGLSIYGLFFLINHYQNRSWSHFARVVEHQMRMKSFAHVQTLDMLSLGDQSTGRMLHLINADAGEMKSFLESGMNDAIRIIVTIVVLNLAAFVVSPWLALMGLLFIPLVWWLTRFTGQQMGPEYMRLQDAVSDLNHLLASNLSGMETVKSFTAEQDEFKRVNRSSEAVVARSSLAVAASSTLSNTMQFTFCGLLFVTSCIGGLLYLQGLMSFSAFLALLFVSPLFFQCVQSLDRNYSAYQSAKTATQRLLVLLETPTLITSGDQSIPIEHLRGEILFRHVSFGYRSDVETLQDITLHIQPNSTVAFVGPTGAGKTSIVKLIMRFYDAHAGDILVDHLNIRQWHLQSLRQAIGFVSQDVYLFPGTVYENVLYGRPNATYEDVVEACRIAEAHHFIMQMPQGYETVVGERGHKLSGGQRQRLSIARAILKDAPILILDEATASVDSETEAAIQRSIERFSPGRTIILIAHRLSTISQADTIYVLADGKLREQGRHNDLIDQRGLYATLWNVQHNTVEVPTPNMLPLLDDPIS